MVNTTDQDICVYASSSECHRDGVQDVIFGVTIVDRRSCLIYTENITNSSCIQAKYIIQEIDNDCTPLSITVEGFSQLIKYDPLTVKITGLSINAVYNLIRIDHVQSYVCR